MHEPADEQFDDGDEDGETSPDGTEKEPQNEHRRMDVDPRNILPVALLVEGGIGVLAIFLSWLVDFPLEDTIATGEGAAGKNAVAALIGVGAAIPLLVGLFLVDYLPFRQLSELRQLVDQHVVPLFARCSLLHFALISAVAGVGEELLFRGLIQGGLTSTIGGTTGVLVGLIVASLFFGLCHWLSNTYLIVATGIGFYLGALFLLTGNLIAPIVTHALYDFVALVYLTRRRP